MIRPRVIVESPFRGDTHEDAARKLDYARECVADSIRRGENPYASHLFFPQVLSDALPDERALGIALGLEWAAVADFVAVYVDLGISEGMRLSVVRHLGEKRRVVLRGIPNNATGIAGSIRELYAFALEHGRIPF